jgi:hypothetical protein
MKSIGFSTTAMVATLLCSQVSAGAVIKPRGRGWEVAAELIKLFGDILKTGKTAFPEKVDAWYESLSPYHSSKMTYILKGLWGEPELLRNLYGNNEWRELLRPCQMQ